MKKTIQNLIYIQFVILLLPLIVACSADTPSNSHPDNKDVITVGEIAPSLTMWLDGRNRSRHSIPAVPLSRDGRSEPEVVMPQTIGVYAFAENNSEVIFNNQLMYDRSGTEILSAGFTDDYIDTWPEDNEWVYAPKKRWDPANRNATHIFYAYAPYIDGSGKMSISNVNLSYDYFNGMTINNVRPIDDQEQLVAGAIWRDAWRKRPMFEMEHMTARLRFCFTVSQAYDDLRDIRVKRVMVEDLKTAHYWQYVIDTSTSPITVGINSLGLYTDYSDTPIEVSPDYVPGPNDPPGLLLSSADGFRDFGSIYAVPQQLPGIVITVVYDVYDEQGVLTRSDRQATNTIDLSSLGVFRRGYYYDILITVSPDFLYVLSDNDVNPDGLIDIPMD